MTITLYPETERGTANHGWLQAKYSFSFGGWHNPALMHFGALRVLNDDIVLGGGGFPTHAHANMEIITIPLQGALQHKDSTGGEGIINHNDVQIMSAGTGVEHSEFNASATDSVNLLQLWIFPKEKNITPRYDQKTFDTANRQNSWQTIVSPTASDATLWINQTATLSIATLTANNSLHYNNHTTGNGMYLFVINGSINVAGNKLTKRYAIGITNTETIEITATENSELLMVEVPMLW